MPEVDLRAGESRCSCWIGYRGTRIQLDFFPMTFFEKIHSSEYRSEDEVWI